MGPIPWVGPPASLLSPSLSFPVTARHPDVRGAALQPQPAPAGLGSCRRRPPHASSRCPGPQVSPLHMPEPLTAYLLRGHRTPPPSSPSVSFPRPTASLHSSAPESFPLPLPTPLTALSTGCHPPLNEIGQGTTVSPVSGEGRHHARVPPLSAWLVPHLHLPFTALQLRCLSV
jgi:hypothetical protein